MISNTDVNALTGLRESCHIDTFLEGQSVLDNGVSELEITRQEDLPMSHQSESSRCLLRVSLRTEIGQVSLTIALLNMISFLWKDLARADFVHTNTDKSNKSNVLIVCLDDDDSSCGHMSDVALTVCQTSLTGLSIVCVDDGAANLLYRQLVTIISAEEDGQDLRNKCHLARRLP